MSSIERQVALPDHAYEEATTREIVLRRHLANTTSASLPKSRPTRQSPLTWWPKLRGSVASYVFGTNKAQERRVSSHWSSLISADDWTRMKGFHLFRGLYKSTQSRSCQNTNDSLPSTTRKRMSWSSLRSKSSRSVLRLKSSNRSQLSLPVSSSSESSTAHRAILSSTAPSEQREERYSQRDSILKLFHRPSRPLHPIREEEAVSTFLPSPESSVCELDISNLDAPAGMTPETGSSLLTTKEADTSTSLPDPAPRGGPNQLIIASSSLNCSIAGPHLICDSGNPVSTPDLHHDTASQDVPSQRAWMGSAAKWAAIGASALATGLAVASVGYGAYQASQGASTKATLADLGSAASDATSWWGGRKRGK